MISNVGDKVGEIAGQAQDTVGDTASGLLDTIKQNPLPAALAGAGLAWLFMKGNDGSSHKQNVPQARAYPMDAQGSGQYRYPVYPNYAGGSEYQAGSGYTPALPNSTQVPAPAARTAGLSTLSEDPIPFGLAGLGL